MHTGGSFDSTLDRESRPEPIVFSSPDPSFNDPSDDSPLEWVLGGEGPSNGVRFVAPDAPSFSSCPAFKRRPPTPFRGPIRYDGGDSDDDDYTAESVVPDGSSRHQASSS
eukprot:Blabericola_migrator_1__9772@NODE_535_length_7764_cov_129_977784_g408_i0_p7_GENE_NODE_535_length_7764_cov_129_977784_g408_i0NODE_535_length_7764_cov_129_977784_g408_i0_p7_ORF_typecomplete_len110_score11_89_NODE_535_length_7764_cov_129_977784_g408_i058046133